MVKIKKYTNGIERFMSSPKGQRFFNFAYSIGAAIVIWGALFKILHLPGGSTLLTIGMGTEIAMFIITAFDRPPKEYAWEEVFPILDSKNPDDRPTFTGGAGGGGVIITGGRGGGVIGGDGSDSTDIVDGGTAGSGSGGGGGVIITGGGGGVIGGGIIGSGGGVIGGGGGMTGGYAAPAGAEYHGEGAEAGAGFPTVSAGQAYAAAGLPGGIALSEEDTTSLRDSISRLSAASEQLSQMAELATATQDYLSQLSGISEQMTQLRETTTALNEVSGVLLSSYKAITDNSGSISRSAEGYVDRMEDLNRNIGGLNTIYEIQLKSISSQLESIDRVNRGLKDIRDMYEKSAAESAHYCEETEKMARYMKQLNSVYEKMITAMTINMYNPMMGGARPDAPSPTDINPFARGEES